MTYLTKDGVLIVDDATVLERSPRRPVRSTQRMITIAALAGLVLALIYMQVAVIGQFRLDLNLFAGLLLATAVSTTRGHSRIALSPNHPALSPCRDHHPASTAATLQPSAVVDMSTSRNPNGWNDATR